MTAPAYSIRPAQAEDVPALSAIELAAAQLLRGHAPESVLAETTDVGRFAEAARDGRLWVAANGSIPVGFALVEMLAEDLPHLEELDVDPSHGRRGLGTALVRTVCEWATVSRYGMLTLRPLPTFRAVPGTSRSTRGWGSRSSLARSCGPSWLPWLPRKLIEVSIQLRERSWGIDAGSLRSVNDDL